MNIYIVEDDITIIKMLENIIEDNDLGSLCGFNTNSKASINEILTLNPDIVLIDLLMPEMDGIQVISELKDKGCKSKFIMISQVSSKSMIAKAYSTGVDFYISKPINIIEVTTIIKNVTEKINYEHTLTDIKNLFSLNVKETSQPPKDNMSQIRKIQLIMNKLGLSGEKGSKDIMSICEYLLSNSQEISDTNIKVLCEKLSTTPKTMEQRIRRAVAKGLTNIAYIGIEDYMNETFVTYSNSLFNFEDVKAEMDYIRGKKSIGGKISMKKFIDGLIINSEG